MQKLCGRAPGCRGRAEPPRQRRRTFGDEEATIIAPAVRQAQGEGLDVRGPWPCDTLFVRAQRGEFDGGSRCTTTRAISPSAAHGLGGELSVAAHCADQRRARHCLRHRRPRRGRPSLTGRPARVAACLRPTRRRDVNAVSWSAARPTTRAIRSACADSRSPDKISRIE